MMLWGKDRFVAVGDEGTILTSKDGTNWVQNRHPIKSSICGLAVNNLLLSEIRELLLSSNGTREETSINTMNLMAKWLNERFIAVGGGMLILSSSDGITWEEILSDPSSNPLMDVAWNGSSSIVEIIYLC